MLWGLYSVYIHATFGGILTLRNAVPALNRFYYRNKFKFIRFPGISQYSVHVTQEFSAKIGNL